MWLNYYYNNRNPSRLVKPRQGSNFYFPPPPAFQAFLIFGCICLFGLLGSSHRASVDQFDFQIQSQHPQMASSGPLTPSTCQTDKNKCPKRKWTIVQNPPPPSIFLSDFRRKIIKRFKGFFDRKFSY